MIIFFLCLRDIIELQTNQIEYLGNTVTLPKYSLLSENTEKSYYFVQFPDDVNCDILSEAEIELDSDSHITSNTCLVFLSPKDIQLIKEQFNTAKISELQAHDKMNSIGYDYANYKHFVGRFHKSFIPKNNSLIQFSKLSDEFYSIKTDNLENVLSIKALRSISKQPIGKLMNRWNSGFIQKNQIPSDLKIPRYFSEKGLNGTGQIITVVDSGLDLNSSYFSDPSEKVEFDVVNKNHRKVVLYTCYGNDKDSTDMHGTHTAGIAAGQYLNTGNSSKNPEKELYNGVAFGSKLNIVDITENEQTGTTVLNFPSLLLGEAMGRVNSKIALNGWGTNRNSDTMYYYDMLAENSYDRLFIFPAGNKGSGQSTITTPGDGKNVLTVGALDTMWGSLFENKNNRNYILTRQNSEEKLNLTILNLSKDYFYTYNYGRKVKNAKIVQDISKITEETIYLTKTTDFCAIINQTNKLNPLAIIYIGDSEPSCSFNDSVNESTNSSNPEFNNTLYTLNNDLFNTYLENHKMNEVISDIPVFYSNETRILDEKIFDFVSIEIEISQQMYEIAQVAKYSSRGPNFVGIQKPDVVAPGTNIYSADSDFVSVSDGTSNAAAYVAGAAALVYEYFERGFYPTGLEIKTDSMQPGADLVRAIIIASADPLPGQGRKPNSASGHGSVNLANILTFNDHLKVFKEIKVANSDHVILKFNLSKEITEDLRIALSYRDSPSTSSTVALSSDIDLYLKLPNQTIIYGNHHEDNLEERFSTNEKILIYQNELQSILKQQTDQKNSSFEFEIHLVAGYGFSTLQHGGLVSFCIHGNLDPQFNEYKIVTIPNGLNECTFPQTGINCQYNATELPADNTTTFYIHSGTSSLVYIPLPHNYKKVYVRIHRFPEISGKIGLQFIPNKINHYANNYPYIASMTAPNSVVSMSRSMFGTSKFVGLRISNFAGIDYRTEATITYEHEIPPPSPTRSLVATIPAKVKMHLGIGFGLFGVFFIPTMVFLVLSCILTRKAYAIGALKKRNRRGRKSKGQKRSTKSKGNEKEASKSNQEQSSNSKKTQNLKQKPNQKNRLQKPKRDEVPHPLDLKESNDNQSIKEELLP
ncbi:hypothetical protein TRFO_33558 [Tritrichomonas foetus]|uniref:Peptidase S8/S53 domain-containing protein n=1 Tax=Tritrichomonas foetus TaxID=1144522 RepID=A0A1J4JRP1_9EUKA|nr:hypothetical protein TRFO_33558 [Tritrichomonas foetus]|eukprot:OHS99916.1 hypothetical protein TRFO_33558 [Tritrichomonas foetus]